MKNRILFDSRERLSLLPLTYLRAVSDCRVGLLTIREKWERIWPGTYGIHTADYLQGCYPEQITSRTLVYINGSILPNQELVSEIQKLKAGQFLFSHQLLIAAYLDGEEASFREINKEDLEERKIVNCNCHIVQIQYPEDILTYGEAEFLGDFQLMSQNKKTAKIPDHVRLRGTDIYIDPTAKIYDCILNASDGPIYIGPSTVIMEQVVIKGPAGIGPNCTVHVGAKLYSNTFLGPYCKVGGEIKRSTIFGYSSKSHDGFLGDSVLGEWCNLGADTNNSNLKNTYGNISLWDIDRSRFRNTGRNFLGMIMGDHTKCAINTAFVTGSVSGIFGNVFGVINPPRFIPSFSWGSEDIYKIEKAIEVAHRTMGRRGLVPSKAYITAIRNIASQT